jgi:hypothetical protein
MFRATSLSLSPLIRKYGTVFTPSGLSAACDEPFGREHWVLKLRVERLPSASSGLEPVESSRVEH